MPKRKNTDDYPKHFVSRWGKVHVYRNVNRSKWTTYVVAWSVGKRRQRMSFSNEEAAISHAENIQAQFAKGEPLAAKVTSQKALYYEACEQKLKGVSLMDAVDYYLAAHGTSVAAKGMATEKILAEMLKSAVKAGNKKRDIETLRSHLTRFAKEVHVPMESVRPVDIDRYLQSPKKWGNRTRNNHRGSLQRFFNWAIDKDYLPSNLANPVDKATIYKSETTSPGIFTPSELEKLLAKAEAKWLPYLTISAFAGVRSAELVRLDWEAVNFEEKVIILETDQTKTKRRRVAHMPDNLVKWLNSYIGDKSGPICPTKTPNKMTRALSKEAKVTWEHNGLRHSYISYQMAILRDAAKVAEQCGNSPQQVQVNYKANTTESEANKWFAISPKKQKGV